MEQVPADVVSDRFDRLVALQERITQEELRGFEGRDVEVMVTGMQGRKDSSTHRVTGREKTGTLVHVGVPQGCEYPGIGDFVTATVTHAARHNLIADPDPSAGQIYAIRH
ncbi:MAG: tRNA (N6-isopentenyl adenosine(37)-C2)-methylthiotransferase MiaB, partial [Bifidobacterium sp.]|jgi:tRNA-2-methylthio-N6-dimethylallyladenosine synthase